MSTQARPCPEPCRTARTRRKGRRTAFTPSRSRARRLPRRENRRSWLYRTRPSAMHPPFRRLDNGLIRSTPFAEVPPPPNRLRWDPLPFPDVPSDFIDGLATMGGNGDLSLRAGVAVHIYRASKSMERRLFADADG